LRIALSKKGVPVRLPDERWVHITEEHSELAGRLLGVIGTVEQPDSVFEGTMGELLAVRAVETEKYLVVVYREMSATDGFVITAFLTKRIRQISRRKQIWPQSS
jgi:hypothetical protein